MSAAFKNASNNPLLVCDDIGRGKPTTRDLPSFGFVYGKGKSKDIEGAKEICSDWVTHKPSMKREATGRNHIARNRAMVSTGFEKSANTTLQSEAKFDAQHCFGTKNRPSTPIGAVIECQYAQEYEDNAEEMYASEMLATRTAGRTRYVGKMTKAAQGHALGAQKRLEKKETVKEEFKLSKFKNVKSTFQVANQKA